MDRNFAEALKLVLKHEGGWSDHPKDPGGATMRGVTLATFRRYVDPRATKDDLRNITQAQLQDVYRRRTPRLHFSRSRSPACAFQPSVGRWPDNPPHPLKET